MGGEKNQTKILKFKEGFSWENIPREAYKEDGSNFKGVSRINLIGTRGESPLFHLRYFEVEPGGYTTFEKHVHEHVVYVLRGNGVIRGKSSSTEVSTGDVIYVAPNDPHQLRNESSEPFGFLCVVNADRDRPIPLEGGTDSSCLGEEALQIIKEAEED
jgi:ribulose-bisphosphate carboxylase large chain